MKFIQLYPSTPASLLCNVFHFLSSQIPMQIDAAAYLVLNLRLPGLALCNTCLSVSVIFRR